MIFLIFKFLVLLLLAALCGALLARWWLRRQYEDVTESFEAMVQTSQSTGSAPWDALEGRLNGLLERLPLIVRKEASSSDEVSALRSEVSAWRKTQQVSAPPADLGPIRERLSAIEEHLASAAPTQGIEAKLASMEQLSKSATAGLATLEGKLDGLMETAGASASEGTAPLMAELARLASKVDAIPTSQELDVSQLTKRFLEVESHFAPVNVRLDKLEDLLQHPPLSDTHLAPIESRLADLEGMLVKFAATTEPPDLQWLDSRLGNLEQAVQGLPKPAPAVDIGPLQSSLDALQQGLAALPTETPEQDLQWLESRLGNLEQAIQGLPKPAPAVDIGPLQSSLDALQQGLAALPTETPDLAPLRALATKLETRMASLEASVSALPEAVPAVDLSSLHDGLTRLRQDLSALSADAPTLDLQPIDNRLLAVESALGNLAARPAPQDTDLRPIDDRLLAVERALQDLLGRPSAQAVDLSPLHEQLQAMDATIQGLHSHTPTTGTTGPELLTSPIHGEPDDLKRISGVGPKLERLLNRNGVYYFWQVASWSPADITFIDDRLDVFKGRIARDNWVAQAGTLMQSETAATAPA